MLPAGDRAFLYKLRKEECNQLITKLGLDIKGTVNFMRMKLVNAAKIATPEQISIFLESKEQFRTARDDVLIKTWVFNMPEEECKEMLEGFDIEPGESDEVNRTLLEKHLNNEVPDQKQEWVDYAKEFCKDLEENLACGSTAIPNPLAEALDNSSQYEDPVEIDHNEGFRENFPRGGNTARRSQPSEIACLMDKVRSWEFPLIKKGDHMKHCNF